VITFVDRPKMRTMKIRNKTIKLPIYSPDATKGVIRALDSKDLKDVGIESLVVNPYHLSITPGIKVIKRLGGLKKLMNWDGLIISDSGGFQIHSMIQRDKSFGKINKDGVIFYRKVNGKKRKYNFTPEKCIQYQFDIGSDIMFSLDYFTPTKPSYDEIAKSVEMTIEWGKRCKDEYLKQIEVRKIKENERPLIFGIVQGGVEKEFADKCARGLLDVGFDGFGLGGFLFDENNNLDLDAIAYISSLTPDSLPRFALGIGYPQGIVDCFKLGYTLFDCVLPTRDGRHKRLYVFKKAPGKIDPYGESDFTKFVYIADKRYKTDCSPISEFCDCYTCQNYSLSYLHHLFSINDSLAYRLATIHNLRTYTLLIEILRRNGRK